MQSNDEFSHIEFHFYKQSAAKLTILNAVNITLPLSDIRIQKIEKMEEK